MSILDTNRVDRLDPGTLENGKRALVLTIVDHLEWREVKEHVDLLTNKVNVYMEYISSKQYKELFPKEKFKAFVFNMYFMHKIPDDCKEYVDRVENLIEDKGYYVVQNFMGPEHEMLKALEDYPLDSKITVEWYDGTTALCEIYSRNIENNTDEFYYGMDLFVQKIMNKGKEDKIKLYDYVTITIDDLPYAIYTEHGNLIWANK